MGLNSDKTFKVFFGINICCFSTRLYIFVPQWHSHPSFIKIVDIFDLDTPQNQNVYCGVSSNDHYTKETVLQQCCLDEWVSEWVSCLDATTQESSQSVPS